MKKQGIYILAEDFENLPIGLFDYFIIRLLKFNINKICFNVLIHSP